MFVLFDFFKIYLRLFLPQFNCLYYTINQINSKENQNILNQKHVHIYQPTNTHIHLWTIFLISNPKKFAKMGKTIFCYFKQNNFFRLVDDIFFSISYFFFLFSCCFHGHFLFHPHFREFLVTLEILFYTNRNHRTFTFFLHISYTNNTCYIYL